MQPPAINNDGTLLTPHQITEWKARDAVARHLNLPDGASNDYRLTPQNVNIVASTAMWPDSVFGPRRLYVMRVDTAIHVIRVMTHPLQHRFTAHTEYVG